MTCSQLAAPKGGATAAHHVPSALTEWGDGLLRTSGFSQQRPLLKREQTRSPSASLSCSKFEHHLRCQLRSVHRCMAGGALLNKAGVICMAQVSTGQVEGATWRSEHVFSSTTDLIRFAGSLSNSTVYS